MTRRKVVIEWLPEPKKSGWFATHPSGRRARWYNGSGDSFLSWALGFLRKDGDIVEVHYPKTIVTYTMRSRRRSDG